MNKKIVLFDIDYTLFDTGRFKRSNLTEHKLYVEIIEALEKISKIAELGIFSEGNLDFQSTKLKKTDLAKYFQKKHIHIVDKKDDSIEKILEKYKEDNLFLIDDKLTVLCKAKIMMPSVFTVWIKRGFYAQNQKPIEGFAPDFSVLNLTETVDIIKNN